MQLLDNFWQQDDREVVAVDEDMVFKFCSQIVFFSKEEQGDEEGPVGGISMGRLWLIR